MAESCLYYTVGPIPDGRIIAIVTEGHPQYGDKNVTVVHLEVVKDETEGNELIEKWKEEKPWIKRQ